MPTAASVTADGNHYVVGNKSPGQSILEDAWIVKLDPRGNTVWQKAFDSGAWDWFAEVAATRVDDDAGSDVWTGGQWIVRLDRDGRVLWQRVHLDEANACFIADIRNANDGGYVVAGSRNYGPFQQACLMNIDSASEVVWQKTYDDAQTRGK